MAANPSSHTQHSFISPLHSKGSERLSLAVTFQKITHNAVELLHLDDCAVALLDEAGVNLIVQPAPGESVDEAQIVFPLDMKPLAALVEQRETLILRNMHLDARMQVLAVDIICTLACLPLLDQGQLLGVLIARSSSQDAFPPEQLRILTLLAEQVVIATHNARQAELVRDADRMKANFLSLVTHELRSPLNTINGYLDLILEGIAGEISEQQQEFIRRARAGSEHLYALLEDLLLASRADADQLRLHRSPSSLEELVTGAIDELEMTALDGQVTLEAELAGDLPLLLVDSVRLQQVLRNLLINALRFTPPGGRVTVSAGMLPARQSGQTELVEVRVRDSGIGIAPEYHDAIFKRFFQIPPAAGGRSSGQGLGLTIVKMIVELHGGQVWVESVLGEGSVFVFTLQALCP